MREVVLWGFLFNFALIQIIHQGITGSGKQTLALLSGILLHEWKTKKMGSISWNLQKGNWGQWKCPLLSGDFGVVMSLGGRFEFTSYLRESNYKIKPHEVMSMLLGTRQPRFLVLGHCAEPALGDIPGIPAEYERSTQPRKAGKSVLLKRGKGCCLFSGFNLYKSKKENQKIKEWEDWTGEEGSKSIFLRQECPEQTTV